MQAVKPHILVVELCADRASVMQMDEETILREARDFSYGKTIRNSHKLDNISITAINLFVDL